MQSTPGSEVPLAMFPVSYVQGLLCYLARLDVKKSGITIGQLLPRYILPNMDIRKRLCKIKIPPGWIQFWTTPGKPALATSRSLIG